MQVRRSGLPRREISSWGNADATLRAEDAAKLRPEWDEVVTQIGGALVFRD